jgi:hypothetical protein
MHHEDEKFALVVPVPTGLCSTCIRVTVILDLTYLQLFERQDPLWGYDLPKLRFRHSSNRKSTQGSRLEAGTAETQETFCERGVTSSCSE